LGNISNDALSELSLKVAKLNTSKCYGNCHGDCHSDDRNGYNVTVVKKSSDFQLIRFVADIINQETNRKLEVTQRAGAVIVT
ncbi:non-canonical purine NTP pyrophosphatase, partial [Pediococcus acidilactici]